MLGSHCTPPSLTSSTATVTNGSAASPPSQSPQTARRLTVQDGTKEQIKDPKLLALVAESASLLHRNRGLILKQRASKEPRPAHSYRQGMHLPKNPHVVKVVPLYNPMESLKSRRIASGPLQKLLQHDSSWNSGSRTKTQKPPGPHLLPKPDIGNADQIGMEQHKPTQRDRYSTLPDASLRLETEVAEAQGTSGKLRDLHGDTGTTSDKDEVLNVDDIGDGIVYIEGGIGCKPSLARATTKAIIQNKSAGRAQPRCYTACTTFSKVAGETRKGPRVNSELVQLKREVFDRKQRLSAQESDFAAFGIGIDSLDLGLSTLSIKRRVLTLAEDSSHHSQMTARSLSTARHMGRGYIPPTRNKQLQETVKCSPQAMLRPITTKSRHYQRSIKIELGDAELAHVHHLPSQSIPILTMQHASAQPPDIKVLCSLPGNRRMLLCFRVAAQSNNLA